MIESSPISQFPQDLRGAPFCADRFCSLSKRQPLPHRRARHDTLQFPLNEIGETHTLPDQPRGNFVFSADRNLVSQTFSRSLGDFSIEQVVA